MARVIRGLQENQGSQEYPDPQASEVLQARRVSAIHPPATRPTGRTATAKGPTSEYTSTPTPIHQCPSAQHFDWCHQREKERERETVEPEPEHSVTQHFNRFMLSLDWRLSLRALMELPESVCSPMSDRRCCKGKRERWGRENYSTQARVGPTHKSTDEERQLIN